MSRERLVPVTIQTSDGATDDLLLDIRELRVELHTRSGRLQVLNDVNLRIAKGESVGLVGESGSGKTLTCLAVVGLLPTSAEVLGGVIEFDGTDLRKASKSRLRRIRGKEIGMILQDPMSSLNPTQTIGSQIVEPIREHLGVSRRDAKYRAIDLIQAVQIPEAATRFKAYPHEMSGGMRQRVVGAIAISCDPALLIADEPTTALDVTIQAQYISLLRRLQEETGCALLLVTHDLAVVSATCDRVAVMYAGRIVEVGPLQSVLTNPRHPYTRGLLESLPSLTGSVEERLVSIAGQPPDPGRMVEGCSFAPRCEFALPECREGTPSFTWHDPEHGSACLRAAKDPSGHFMQEASATPKDESHG